MRIMLFFSCWLSFADLVVEDFLVAGEDCLVSSRNPTNINSDGFKEQDPRDKTNPSHNVLGSPLP